MADRAVGAHNGLEVARAVEHGAVLHRRAGADDDPALVAAQHGLRPHRDPGTEHDVADDRRIGVHEGLGVDLRDDVAEAIQGHGRGK